MALLALVFDLLKGIAWPLAVFGIACLFRREIKALLPRIKRAGPSGIEVSEATAIEIQEYTKIQQPGEITAKPELKQLPGISRTPAIADLEMQLHESLTRLNPQHPVDVLIRELAESRLRTFFERVYNLITGSQIRLLRYLNTAQNASMDEVGQFFETTKTQFPEIYSEATLEQWLGFLLRWNLIQANNDKLVLTKPGKDFLLFLHEQGLADKNG
jgi:hypothetical protein